MNVEQMDTADTIRLDKTYLQAQCPVSIVIHCVQCH
jgi:hypothetical protein